MQQFEHRTLNVQRRTSNVGGASLCLYYKWQDTLFDVQRSMFDVHLLYSLKVWKAWPKGPGFVAERLRFYPLERERH